MQTKNTDIERPKKILEAIRRLRPNAQFALREETIEWHDKQQSEPTQEEIETEIAYLESEEYKKEEWRKTACLSRRKFMIAIKLYPYKTKTLHEAILALIDTLEEPEKTIIQTSLQESTEFERNNKDLIAIATKLNMTNEEIDDFYTWAEQEKWREINE